MIYSLTSAQVVVGIAGGHVLAAAWDQFVGNVMRGEGGLHQVEMGVTRTKNVLWLWITNIVIPGTERPWFHVARPPAPSTSYSGAVQVFSFSTFLFRSPRPT